MKKIKPPKTFTKEKKITKGQVKKALVKQLIGKGVNPDFIKNNIIII